MRLSLIGPGDIKFHYIDLLGLKKENLLNEFDEIGKILAEAKIDIVILPDKGASLEVARSYKKYNGKKLIACYPKSDKTFGIKHLLPVINEKYLFDDLIDTENWFKHDLIKGLLGNAILCLGNSPGTSGELNYAIYLYKIMTNQKENLKIRSKIHKDIRAGDDFTIFVYSPFAIDNLPKETEKYIQKFNIKLVYIKNTKQLKEELAKLQISN